MASLASGLWTEVTCIISGMEYLIACVRSSDSLSSHAVSIQFKTIICLKMVQLSDSEAPISLDGVISI